MEWAGWQELAIAALAVVVGIDYRIHRGIPERLAAIDAELKAIRRDIERLFAERQSTYHPHHDGERIP